jgi:hypothetical protein
MESHKNVHKNVHIDKKSLVCIMSLWPHVWTTNLEHFTRGALEDIKIHKSMIHLEP